MYLATADCDAAARRVTDAGGTIVMDPMQVMEQGRMAIAKDPVGAQFGLWQGGAHVGCEVVNEPGSLLRNDLVTSDPEPARAFYAAVFDFTLDGNPDLPDLDFTFLRRPDGHEIGGIMGVPGVPSGWTTLFEVADTDTAVARAARRLGGAGTPRILVYGRTPPSPTRSGPSSRWVHRPAGLRAPRDQDRRPARPARNPRRGRAAPYSSG